jgi:hypothetical protein
MSEEQTPNFSRDAVKSTGTHNVDTLFLSLFVVQELHFLHILREQNLSFIKFMLVSFLTIIIYLRFSADINVVGATFNACFDCLFTPMSVGSDTVYQNFAHLG